MSDLDNVISNLKNLKLDCDFWDVRIEDSFETSIDLIDGEVVTCTSSPSLGAFLRVRQKGYWFYESTTELDQIKNSLEALTKLKVETQKADYKYMGATQPAYLKMNFEKTKLSQVPLADKLALAKDYFSVLKKNKKVSSTNLRYRDVYKVKSYLNSLGTEFKYDFNQCGIKLYYTVSEASNIFDDSLMLYGSRFDELKNKEKIILAATEESLKFLDATSITPGKYTVLLDPEVTGVFTHESFGHKSEADFMLGDAQALKDWKLGTKIASENLTIVDYGGHENTSGYCPIDDEGTLAQKNYLIKNGILTGRLHTIDTAIQLDEKPTGNCRAMNFEFEPIVRMTSTYIEPGTESLDSIMSRSEGAILLEGVKHGSGLSTFTIAPTRGYKIGKNGVKQPVRVSVISGSVFETLKNIEAVSSDFQLLSSAIGGCGKMEQWPLSIADGGPFVLVKEMQVS